MIHQCLQFVGLLSHLQPSFLLLTSFPDVEMKLPKIIADFSLRFEKNLTARLLRTTLSRCRIPFSRSRVSWHRLFWCFANDGVGQVMFLNALGIDAKHIAHKSRSGVEDSRK